jgi:predicted DNA-binding protein with PD1-like motif
MKTIIGALMRIRTFLSFFIVCFNVAIAQKTLLEVASPQNPQHDSKPNNDSVPNVYTINSQFNQVFVLRLKYQTDLLKGVESVIKEKSIRNAVILSGIGSVRNYHFHTIANRTFPTKNIFVRDSTAPANITGMNGYVIDGRVHAHVTFSNEEHAFGGHLEYGTEVFTFAVITIGVLIDGTDLRSVDDKNYR